MSEKKTVRLPFHSAGESYTSHVTLFEPHLVTAVCPAMQLFHHLKTVWKFSPGLEDNPNTSQLDFAVAFQFRGSVHSTVSRLFFDEVIRRNVNAFLSEAEARFGPESIPRQRPTDVYSKS